jgi:hypothetical protein
MIAIERDHGIAWQRGLHLALHVKADRAIVGALDVCARHAPEPFRAELHRSGQGRERLCHQSRRRRSRIFFRHAVVEDRNSRFEIDRDPLGIVRRPDRGARADLRIAAGHVGQ